MQHLKPDITATLLYVAPETSARKTTLTCVQHGICHHWMVKHMYKKIEILNGKETKIEKIDDLRKTIQVLQSRISFHKTLDELRYHICNHNNKSILLLNWDHSHNRRVCSLERVKISKSMEQACINVWIITLTINQN